MFYRKLILILLSISSLFCSQDIEITPYKFTDSEYDQKRRYFVPSSSRFLAKRTETKAPNIIFYLTKPKVSTYPIAIICGGSTSFDDVESIIHFHRYFLKEFLDLSIAVVSVEQWGIDGDHIDKKEFLHHYTRTQRLKDHRDVIEHLKEHPPLGWNKKLIFLGVSEGGPLVTSLTGEYSDITLAAINWCGAGNWPWREELWIFLQKLVGENPQKCAHLEEVEECFSCDQKIISREFYDHRMNETIQNPTSDLFFGGMTYLYHADAQSYFDPDYQRLKTPFLVVTGIQDTIIGSSDDFVKKAKQAGVPITYYRIADMDHYIRKRPGIIQASFKWLKSILEKKIHDNSQSQF
ncbi:MAG: alpha/beta hydrolase family protein [Janthinobacterium lividum]